MQINDAVIAFSRVLQLHPVAQRAKVIAKMQIAGRLHAGKNAGHDWFNVLCVSNKSRLDQQRAGGFLPACGGG